MNLAFSNWLDTSDGKWWRAISCEDDKKTIDVCSCNARAVFNFLLFAEQGLHEKLQEKYKEAEGNTATWLKAYEENINYENFNETIPSNWELIMLPALGRLLNRTIRLLSDDRAKEIPLIVAQKFSGSDLWVTLTMKRLPLSTTSSSRVNWQRRRIVW